MPIAYFFRPSFDLPTRFMNFWLGLAKQDVAGLGFQVLDSSGEYATSYSFFDTMQTYNPDIVIADGHGDSNSLTGQGLQEVLRACTNNEVLSGKVMCAVSCLTGQGLGPDSRNKNATAYVGWVNEFTWVVSPEGDPANDPVAYCFQQIIRKMVSLCCQYQQQQISLRNLYDGVVAEFDYWIGYYSVPPGSNDPYASDILLSLRHDKTGMVTLGKEAIITPALEVSLAPLVPIATGSLLLFALTL